MLGPEVDDIDDEEGDHVISFEDVETLLNEQRHNEYEPSSPGSGGTNMIAA